MKEYVFKLENAFFMKLAIILGMFAMMVAKTCEGRCGIFIFYEEEIPRSLIKNDVLCNEKL